MMAGRISVRDGVVLTADQDAVSAEAQIQAKALARRVAADLVRKGMALMAAAAILRTGTCAKFQQWLK
jgi:hypothetical protein